MYWGKFWADKYFRKGKSWNKWNQLRFKVALFDTWTIGEYDIVWYQTIWNCFAWNQHQSCVMSWARRLVTNSQVTHQWWRSEYTCGFAFLWSASQRSQKAWRTVLINACQEIYPLEETFQLLYFIAKSKSVESLGNLGTVEHPCANLVEILPPEIWRVQSIVLQHWHQPSE